MIMFWLTKRFLLKLSLPNFHFLSSTASESAENLFFKGEASSFAFDFLPCRPAPWPRGDHWQNKTRKEAFSMNGYLVWLILAVIAGIVCYFIGKEKGRDPALWFASESFLMSLPGRF
jgi:hypothetical protein